MISMLSVKAAREQILASIKPVEEITLPLQNSAGAILARDIFSATDLPPFDNSSVDGFAVRADDLIGAEKDRPRTLEVIEDIPAGFRPTKTIAAGTCARIMTGAPIPAGADAVVMIEDTDAYERAPDAPAPPQAIVYKSIQPGANLRLRGSDLRAGEKVLTAGRLLRPQDVGLLAMLGIALVSVRRKPRVAILSSGDEILPVGAPLTPGKVYDANTYTLTALAEESGCEVINLGVAADRREAVSALLDRASDLQADVIVASAGVSVGAFDFVKDAVAARGALDFWKVDMRPGKPLAFGAYRSIPFFGLPGNPVSAFVGFLVFVQPALERLSGRETVERPRVRVRLAEAIASDGHESYLRAMVRIEDGAFVARLTGHQGSGNLLSLVQANALLIIPSGVKSLPLNAEAEAWLLENTHG
jgi:molybdopterin molybdotransferase